MRISSVNGMPVYTRNKISKAEIGSPQQQTRIKVVSLSSYLASPMSFRGRNKEQAIFYGAEVAPYSKAGGVGVVMKDYASILEPQNEVVVSPYYGADVDTATGKVTPKKDEDGDYILPANGQNHKLVLVDTKSIFWGKDISSPVMLFRLKEEKDRVHYFVFDDATGHYKKPYEGGTVYATGAKSETNEWNGDPYAKNSKAFVELLPSLLKDKTQGATVPFNPATVVCSDSQTAYAHEYMAQKHFETKEYDGIKTTHVGHNLGSGYCGETSMQNMFVNLGATPKQIKLIEEDPMYQDGILGDKYFEPFVRETLDSTGTASATMIPLNYAEKGLVKSFSVVAEDYAQSIAENPQTAHNIHNKVRGLYQQGIFNGILNPLQDTSIDASKKLPNARYNEDCVDIDEAQTVYPKFEVYPKDASYEEMRRIKTANKIKFLERLSAEDNSIITGDKNRKASVNPEARDIYNGPAIRPDLIEKLKNGEEVPMFVSWGRIDTQKGHDISLGAFEKFAKTPEGKDAIFILGAGLDKSAESERIEKKLTQMLADPELQGRIVHIDGWAPAYAMASAADAAIFTSRFEPCGLTDLEAMKYFCVPIVTNTQGFKQKNFDPRVDDPAKATSFKTQHEFDLKKEDVQKIIDAYVHGDETAKSQVEEEFPLSLSTYVVDEDGNEILLFENFATKYKEFIDARRKELELKNPDGELPEKWNDWDELSKEYSFRYAGFARELKDNILKDETAAAISSFVKSDESVKATIYENLKNLNTGWKGNASLHPSTNESSYEMYRRLHMEPESVEPKKEELISKDFRFVEKTIKQRQEKDLEERRIGSYLAGALTGATALIAARLKRAGMRLPDADLTDKIDELTKQLQEREEVIKSLNDKVKQLTDAIKTGRSAMIKSGLIGSVCATAVTLTAVFVLKKKIEKKQQATQEIVEHSSKPEIKENPSASSSVTSPIAQKAYNSGIQPGGIFSGFAQ